MNVLFRSLLGTPSEAEQRRAAAMLGALVAGLVSAFFAVSAAMHLATFLLNLRSQPSTDPEPARAMFIVLLVPVVSAACIGAGAAVGQLIGRGRSSSFQGAAWQSLQIGVLAVCAATLGACAAAALRAEDPRRTIYLLGAAAAGIGGANLLEPVRSRIRALVRRHT